MRTLLLVGALVLAGTAFVSLAPSASAFTFCTSPGVAGHECSDYYVCVGWGINMYGQETCATGIPKDFCECIPF